MYLDIEIMPSGDRASPSGGKMDAEAPTDEE
jgi:hypothetical protein